MEQVVIPIISIAFQPLQGAFQAWLKTKLSPTRYFILFLLLALALYAYDPDPDQFTGDLNGLVRIIKGFVDIIKGSRDILNSFILSVSITGSMTSFRKKMAKAPRKFKLFLKKYMESAIHILSNFLPTKDVLEITAITIIKIILCYIFIFFITNRLGMILEHSELAIIIFIVLILSQMNIAGDPIYLIAGIIILGISVLIQSTTIYACEICLKLSEFTSCFTGYFMISFFMYSLIWLRNTDRLWIDLINANIMGIIGCFIIAKIQVAALQKMRDEDQEKADRFSSQQKPKSSQQKPKRLTRSKSF